MMITFGILYIFTYITIMMSIKTLLTKFIPVTLLASYSLPNYFIFINRYSIAKNTILLQFFFLSGIPPFGLFFIKLNLFSYLLYQIHIAFIVLFYILFFVNMIFYIQVFNFKNFKKNIYFLVHTTFFKTIVKTIKFKYYYSTYLTFKSLYLILLTSFILMFSIYFYVDFYLILSLK